LTKISLRQQQISALEKKEKKKEQGLKFIYVSDVAVIELTKKINGSNFTI